MKLSRHGDFVAGDVAKTGDKSCHNLVTIFFSLLLKYSKVGGLIKMKHVIISFIFISFSQKVGSAGV
mgnify:CR=1 FL=1